MFEIIKNVIESRDYELVDMLYKINKMYIESNITDEQKQELDNLARQNAKAENSYASVQEQINRIYEKLDSIEVRVAKLEETEGTSEPGKEEEYPEYVQPQGAHDAYKSGDKITCKGKIYICQMNGCVWTPDDYPKGWQEVEG